MAMACTEHWRACRARWFLKPCWRQLLCRPSPHSLIWGVDCQSAILNSLDVLDLVAWFRHTSLRPPELWNWLFSACYTCTSNVLVGGFKPQAIDMLFTYGPHHCLYDHIPCHHIPCQLLTLTTSMNICMVQANHSHCFGIELKSQMCRGCKFVRVFCGMFMPEHVCRCRPSPFISSREGHLNWFSAGKKFHGITFHWQI